MSGIRCCIVTHIKLKFVQAFSLSGKRYYYFRKSGCVRVRLPGLPGSAEFNAAYANALTASSPRTAIGAGRNGPGTVAALVALYAVQCAKFNHEIAAETRRTQWAMLQRFRDEHGEKRVAMLNRQHVEAMLAGKAPYPRRNWVKAVRPLMQFAVSVGMIAEDPTQDVKVAVSLKGEGFRAWGEDEIAAFRTHHQLGTRARLAFELLLKTVQRRADAIRMGPQHIKKGLLHVRQQKTGEPLALPIMPELQAALDATPTKHLTFLTTAAGKPFAPAGFGNWFREMCDDAGLYGFSAHGLRKAGCRRLAEAGCTASEIAAWSGHRTLSEIAHYTRAADQAAMARAAATKLRTLLSNPGGPECQTPEKSQLKQRTEG
jgi:integrase